MKENCIIVGAGTYGQVYAEYLRDQFNVIGFIDDDTRLQNKEIGGIKIIGDFDFLLNNIEKNINVFIPIGNNETRVRLLREVNQKGFKTPNFIHQTAQIHHSVKIGKGVYILSGTHIMPLVEIEDFVLVSMGVNIAHHTIIEQGCFFSQGSNIGASIHFRENVFCGIGSMIMTGIKKIGKNATIGAGAVIIKDIPDGATVVGNPGRIIRYNP